LTSGGLVLPIRELPSAPPSEAEEIAIPATEPEPEAEPRFWAAFSWSRLQRADVFFLVAMAVAVAALLWAALGNPARVGASPTAAQGAGTVPMGLWERTLVELGVAEAPEPVVVESGNPEIQVWVDPHHALYYCPGAELYGKTPNGKLSSQKQAQMDRFEPAGRAACE
jgi:hypothetical protein